VIENGNGNGNGNGSPDTAWVAAVAALISGSTQTIVSRIDAMERSENDRWRLHDEELERNRTTVTTKFLKIEAQLDAHIKIANDRWAKEHDDDVRMDARIRPLRGSIAWLWTQRRDIVIVLVGIIGLLAIAADIAARYLGGAT